MKSVRRTSYFLVLNHEPKKILVPSGGLFDLLYSAAYRHRGGLTAHYSINIECAQEFPSLRRGPKRIPCMQECRLEQLDVRGWSNENSVVPHLNDHSRPEAPVSKADQDMRGPRDRALLQLESWSCISWNLKN